MAKTVEGRNAARRSRPSEDVARQTDASEIAQTTIDFQMRRLLARFDFSPERALAVAELAFATTGRR